MAPRVTVIRPGIIPRRSDEQRSARVRKQTLDDAMFAFDAFDPKLTGQGESVSGESAGVRCGGGRNAAKSKEAEPKLRLIRDRQRGSRGR